MSGTRGFWNPRWRAFSPPLAGMSFTLPKKKRGQGYTLIANHAFVDGNKRIGMYVMLTFLEVNGIRLDCTNDEVAAVGLAVAAGQMDYESLLIWVREHRI